VTRVHIITGIFGDYDALKEQPAQVGVDVSFTCVTDNPHLTSTDTWQVVCQPRSDLTHPRLAAKVPKVQPWEWTGTDAYVIWMDGSFILKDECAVTRLLDVVHPDIAAEITWQFRHPARDCVFTEAEFSATLPKYYTQPIEAQAQHYRKLGHPDHWGLWATGFIVYPHWSVRREHIARRWLEEQVRWTNQDQVSQPFVWRQAGDSPINLPGELLVNDFVTLHPHLDGT